jgi:hypothetical protein
MLMALAQSTADWPTRNPRINDDPPHDPTFLRLHPAELTVLIESYWGVRSGRVAAIPHLGAQSAFLQQLLGSLRVAPRTQNNIVGHHLMYAYMIENTRILEIFRRVLQEYRYGEKLGVPIAGAGHWLEATEALWFGGSNPLMAGPMRSDVRPDLAASRRNAYQRMFGMDLNHGAEDGQPYRYPRAEAGNTEFVATFEELLREVWVGITNLGNTSGATQTDEAKIGMLADNLRNMLRSRRLGGNLQREEFDAVTMMSWLHLTVDFNSPIVRSIRAEAESPAERLFKIATKVGLPAHGLSDAYFRIATPLSDVLRLLESVSFATPGAARALIDGSIAGAMVQGQTIPAVMTEVITYWSIITGRDMKARKVSTN